MNWFSAVVLEQVAGELGDWVKLFFGNSMDNVPGNIVLMEKPLTTNPEVFVASFGTVFSELVRFPGTSL